MVLKISGAELASSFNNNRGGVAGGDRGRILGKLAGRRIRLEGHTLHIPNTTQGRGLAALMTGQAATKGQNGSLVVDCRAIGGDMGDLLALLTTISLAVQAVPEIPAEISPVLQELLDFGIDIEMAGPLAADPWVTVERVGAWRSHLAHSPNNLANPPGIMISKLRKHIEAPQNSRPRRSEEQRPMEQLRIPDNPDKTGLPGVRQDLDGSGVSPATIWQTTCDELRRQMDAGTFNAWLRRSLLVDYRNDNGLPLYVVQVHNQRAQAWLEQRLRKVILRTLSAVAGQEVEIRFVLPE